MAEPVTEGRLGDAIYRVRAEPVDHRCCACSGAHELLWVAMRMHEDSTGYSATTAGTAAR